MNITIREVTEEDAEALSAIYRPYVEETGITFEYVPPDAEEFRRRIQHTKEKYPYLSLMKILLTLPPAMKAKSSAMPTPGLS